MMERLSLLLAQAAADPAPAQPMGPFGTMTIPIILSIVVLLVMSMMPRREDKKLKQMMDSLKKNDRELLVGGIYGRVVLVKPNEDEVVVRVDEDRDVKLTVTKSAILKKIEKTEEAGEKPAAAKP
jgi:preprotein translocase YajC subunit